MSEPVGSPLDELMRRLADGDREAFDPVFRQLWPVVLRVCRALLPNDADAADAAQQAMLSILTRSAEYDAKRPALPWALGIATWECRTLRRKTERRREAPFDVTTDSRRVESEELILERELVATATEAMASLDERDRETLATSFWQEANHVSGATLRKRKERAIGRLKQAFRRLYGLD